VILLTLVTQLGVVVKNDVRFLSQNRKIAFRVEKFWRNPLHEIIERKLDYLFRVRDSYEN